MNANNKRLKVLFITDFLPWPLTSGGIIRSYHILRQMSLRHEVTLVTTYNEYKDDHFEKFVAHIHAIKSQPTSKLIKILGALSSIASTKPYLFVYSHFREEMAECIRELLNKSTFDLVHIDHLDAAAYLPYCGTTPIYLDEHNFETNLLRSIINNTDNIFLRYYLKQQNKKLAIFEASALKQSHAIGAVSKHDANLMAEVAPKKRIEIIPNGVDLDFFNIERTPHEWKIISVGSLDWPPNVDGILWFLDKVWPLICRLCPKATFNIVGRNPPNSLLDRADNNVIIAASVPDVREYVKTASVFVVPLFSGGGTRLKVLEAMAMRVPIVSTPIGIEGIECEDGRDVLVAEHPDQFAEKVVEVLNDSRLAERISNTAHTLVEKQYGWGSIGDKLNDVYRTITIQ